MCIYKTYTHTRNSVSNIKNRSSYTQPGYVPVTSHGCLKGEDGRSDCPLPCLSTEIPSGFVHAAPGWEFPCTSVLLCLEDTVSMKSFITSNSYNLSVSSSTQRAGPWGEGFDEDIPFRIKCFRVSHSLHTVQCVFLCYSPYTARRSFSSSCVDWERDWSMGIAVCH